MAAEATAPRIAYLAGRYPTTSHTFILREARELERLGWDVSRFSIWRSRDEDLLSDEEIEERDHTYSVLPLGARQVRDLARAHLAAVRRPRAYLRTLRSALGLAAPGARGGLLGLSWFAVAILLWDRCRRGRIAHLHVHLAGTATFDAMLAARYARAAGDRLDWSMTVHGSFEFSRVEQERLAEKVRDARLLVCISEYTRSQLMAVSAASDWGKIRVVRCGVPTERFAPKPRDERDPGAPLRVLTVGRLDRAKGQAVMLEAVEIAARRGVELTLELIGAGDQLDELREMISEKGLGAIVTLRGAVSQDEIPDAYSRADAFVLSSFAEGVPIVLMEAMATELPVVSTWITGIPELITDERDGLLVPPARADELADAFERLAADHELRRRLGAAGRQTVRSHYDLDTNVRELEAIFRTEL